MSQQVLTYKYSNQQPLEDKKKKSIYFENLNGLRFLCFLSVFFFHSFHTEFDNLSSSSVYYLIKRGIFGNGNLGVNFFFVLSGFLITYLLIEEKKLNGQINLKNFWIRRVLRIWPLFYFCVFFGFIIFPQLKLLFGQTPSESANPIYYLLFLNNFDFIANGLPDASVLGVLWSVAIEEQFYLIWPIVLYVFPIKRYWIPFCIIIAASLIFRAFNDVYLIHEHHTLSCIGDMTIGALGAWIVSEFSSVRSKLENLSKLQIMFIYVAFVLIYFFRDEFLYPIFGLRIVERPLIAIVILLIILEQNYAKNSMFKLAKFKRISKLGEITYGLYCLHFIGILTATTLTKKLSLNTELWQVLVVDTSLALALTFLISLISYKFYEQPFLKFKNRFAYISK